jgi:hypothetical protein
MIIFCRMEGALVGAAPADGGPIGGNGLEESETEPGLTRNDGELES